MSVSQALVIHKNKPFFGHNFLKSFINLLAQARRSTHFNYFSFISKFISSLGENPIKTGPALLYTRAVTVGEIMPRKAAQTNQEEQKKGKILKQEQKLKPKKKNSGSFLLLRCPICLDNLHTKAAVATRCGHVFCRKCLQRALTTSTNCPTCRKKLSASYRYHPLFLNTNYDDDVKTAVKPAEKETSTE